MCSGRVERAGRALVWLRGGSRDSVQDELNTIQLNLAADRAASQASTGQHRSEVFSLCCLPAVLNCIYRGRCSRLLKPVLTVSAVMFFTRFSGVIAFNFYAVTIFSEVL